MTRGETLGDMVSPPDVVEAELPTISGTLNASTALTVEKPSLQDQVTFFEDILGFTFEMLRISDVTVKQQGDSTTATVVVQIRATQAGQEPSIYVQERLSTIAVIPAASTARATKAPEPGTAVRRSSAHDPAASNIPATSTTPKLPSIPKAGDLFIEKQQSDPVFAAKRTSGTGNGPSRKVKRPRGASGPQKDTPAPPSSDRDLSAPTISDQKATSSTAVRCKKPLYATECPFEMNGKCNRAACNLLHEDQQEYFFGPQYKIDEYPWKKERPQIVSDFQTDLPKYKIKQSDWDKQGRKRTK
ncbi:hypothetical protein C7974DRAFT_371476 [Boeremia exigua]|uniref:uncharacterized protein n=1 Tax=Boeremia exigua TaxID=749465 RepID=UPI001E8DE385|nr:uncharacterized protein C7974DRAFT_371476 [Boeremia exigua]KAH6644339.1 hypothetical protein C7974DRAFT_371476 [Boeremia exigua]